MSTTATSSRSHSHSHSALLPSSSSSSSSTASLLSAQPSITLEYSIAAVSSYSASYTPDNIRVDRPHDLTSRWSGASVAVAPPPVSSSIPGLGSGSPSTSLSTSNNGNTTRSGSASGRGSSPGGTGGASNTSGGAGSRSMTTLGLAPVNGTASGKQYVVLKLERPSVVKSIYFGKYNKAHPCNLKDFKVYGGPSSDPHSRLWTRLLRAGLKNDAVAEDFALKWTDAGGTPLPLVYIKVVPLAAHSPNYNFSVWHVALRGVSDPTLIGRATQEYDEQCESHTTRLILKHLRARGHHSAYQALLASSKLDSATSDVPTRFNAPTRRSRRPFEHPLVTQLYQAIMRGDWEAAENCLDIAAGLTGPESSAELGRIDSQSNSGSLFAAFVSRCSQQAEWTRLLGTDADGDIPCARGGHQLVLDTVKSTAYLFGGWDGKADLNDLWIYYIEENRWRCISRDTTQQGGPSPRSCHRMTFDSRSGIIYVLGRYVDYETQQRQSRTRQADSSPSRGTIAADTESSAGLPPTAGASAPRLARDRAPAGSPGSTTPLGGSDPVAASGRASTLSPTSAAAAAATRGSPRPQTSAIGPHTSDFFRFSTRNERWDRLSSDTVLDGGPKLIFDHQMVVDEESQVLYVFGGRVVHWDPAQLQLSGMWSYDCIQRTWNFLFDDDTRTGGKILSRAGHSMLLDVGTASGDNKRQLWILAGQRADLYLADMYTYNLTNGQVRQISRDYSQGGEGPEGGFTQRATIDSAKREIHLYNGIVRHTGKMAEDVGPKSALWIYRMDRDEWKQVWKGEAKPAVTADEYDDEEEESSISDANEVSIDIKGSHKENATPSSSTRPLKRSRTRHPQPRYASQLVFDSRSSRFLLFGGNPAESPSSSQHQQQGGRLDDLWSLRLLRPHVGEILRRAKFVLRQQRFKEMAAAVVVPKQGLFTNSLLIPPSSAGGAGGGFETDGSLKALEALAYLQTEVAAVVDHQVPEETRTFRSLVAGLLGAEEFSGREGESEGADRGDVLNMTDAERRGIGRAAAAAEEESQRDQETESDGLPAVDEDADMLSVSQTLPVANTEVTKGAASLGVSAGAGVGERTGAGSGSGTGMDSHRTAQAVTGSTSTVSAIAPFALMADLHSGGSGSGGDGAPNVDPTWTSTSSSSFLPTVDPWQPLPVLWRQRLLLFRRLLHCFPSEHVEPIQEELAECVAAWAVRSGAGGGTVGP